MQTVDGSRHREHLFFWLVSGTVLLIVFAGFAPTYYLHLRAWFDAPTLTPLVHLHGLVFTAWVMLFAVQVRLVMTGRAALHRRVGRYGAWLGLAMVLLGAITAVVSAQLGHTSNAAIPPLSFLAIPLFNIAAFGLLVGGGVWQRRDPATHKRLRQLAGLGPGRRLRVAVARRLFRCRARGRMHYSFPQPSALFPGSLARAQTGRATGAVGFRASRRPRPAAAHRRALAGAVWPFGPCHLHCSLPEYRRLAAATGFTIGPVQDITAQTLPVYDFLRSLAGQIRIPKRSAAPETLFAEWASRLGALRYLILEFAKPGPG